MNEDVEFLDKFAKKHDDFFNQMEPDEDFLKKKDKGLMKNIENFLENLRVEILHHSTPKHQQGIEVCQWHNLMTVWFQR